MVTRRSFLPLLAAGALPGPAKRVAARIGLELYSLRSEMKKDAPGTLALARRMGFEEVETGDFYGRTADSFRKELDRADLRATALMSSWADLDQQLDRVAGDAKTLGAGYVACPVIPHKNKQFTAEDCRLAIARFSAWAGALAKNGLTFCYHLHGIEFRPSTNGTLADTLIRETAAAGAMFEMDTFWIQHGGEDPAGFLRRYPGRFPLAHLKDRRPGLATGTHPADVMEEDSVVLGTGTIDWKAFFREAPKAGVRHYYIEEEHPNAIAQIPQSLRFLKELEI